MDWVTDPDRIKVQWRLIYLNLAAVVMNLLIGAWTLRWISLANLFSAGFSLWIAYGLWKKLPEIKKEQQERIMDILSGKYG